MQWRIEGFVFCDQQQTLTKNGNSLQLEPIAVELLTYFCQNPDQIISREQLIENVWQGRLITDNAVSKAITKLRKSLDDDPKKPQFIATFPKKGYRFIGNVTLHKEPAKKKLTSRLTFATAIIVLLAWLFVYTGWKSSPNHNSIVNVKALTRSAGQEVMPRLSPDGRVLSYGEFSDGKLKLWFKSLGDGQTFQLIHEDGDDLSIGPASWNKSGSKIVYLVTSSDSCQYFTRTANGLSFGKPVLVYNCPAGSFGQAIFTHDDNRLVFAESPSRNQPYSIYEFNLTTGKKRRPPQPELYLGGNSQFDLHPSENKLLISSPDLQQWEGFYELDLETNKLKLLFKQDAYICCGIWDHSGERVVLMGEHPAYQLLSYDDNGGDARTVYSGGIQVRAPVRHTNGKDYIFPATDVNLDAYFYKLDSKEESVIANSSVNDFLARLSPDAKYFAYVSFVSDSEDIWIKDRERSTVRQLTDLKHSRHYIDLLWSYGGEFILGLTLNEIHWIDVKTGEFKILNIPQSEIRGMSLKSNNIVSFSTRQSSNWQVSYYDLTKEKIIQTDPKWRYIRYAKNPEDTLWEDQQGHLYLSEKPTPIVMPELKDISFLNGRNFNIAKIGANWAWLTGSPPNKALMFKQGKNAMIEVLSNLGTHDFSLTKEGLIYHKREKQKGDIYQTTSE